MLVLTPLLSIIDFCQFITSIPPDIFTQTNPIAMNVYTVISLVVPN